MVAITFFLLALYITWQAVKSLISREELLTSPSGYLGRAVAGGHAGTRLRQATDRQGDGKPRTGRRLKGETWVCSYLSLTLLLGVGAYAVAGWWWADPVGALAMLPIILWQKWETLAEAREPADHED